MAPHSSSLTWKIPWAEEPGRLYTVHGFAKSQTWLSTKHIKWSLRSLQKFGATEHLTCYKVNGHRPPSLLPTAAHTVTRSCTAALRQPRTLLINRCLGSWIKHRCPGKGQFSFQSQRKAIPMHAQITVQLHSFHNCYQNYVQNLQARLQQYLNWEILDVQQDLEKAENQRSNCPHLLDHKKNQENSRKTSTSASLIMLKLLTVWITTNCGKFLQIWKYQTTLPVSWKVCMQVKKQQLEPDMEQQTGSKLGKEYVKACLTCHPACLTSMQSTGWMKHKLEWRFLEEISITSYRQMTLPLWQKAKRN